MKISKATAFNAPSQSIPTRVLQTKSHVRLWPKRSNNRRFILVCIGIFSFLQSYGQCDITLTFPEGTCGNYPTVLAYVGADGGNFTLHEKVGGWSWQEIGNAPNDAPPVQFNLTVTQTTTFGISYMNDYGCATPIEEFTMSPMPAAPTAVSGDKNLCAGESTILTANGTGVRHRWYEGYTLIADNAGNQFNTGTLNASKTYKVSTVSDAGCESMKINVTVNVDNPTAPQPYDVSRCGYGNVTLSAPNGYSGYQWFNQNNTLLETTTTNSLANVSTTSLTSYKIKVKNAAGCWSSEMSPAAGVELMNTYGPAVSLQTSCTSATMTVTYNDESGSGDYVAEWYTSEAIGTPIADEYLSHATNQASYTTSTSGTYWVRIHDLGNNCRTPPTQVTVSLQGLRSVTGLGWTCTPGTVKIQAMGNGISLFKLYRLSGGTYHHLDENSSGTFEVDGFDDIDAANYYVKGTGTCVSPNYSQVTINTDRPQMPTVSGNVNVCYNMSTTLTASGGTEGAYIWYKNSSPLSGQTGSQLQITNVTASATYAVSHTVSRPDGPCESPQKSVPIAAKNPTAPTPLEATRCTSQTPATLSASGGFSSYKWFDQNNVELGTTATNSFTVTNPGLTSYKLKVRDSWSCWSTSFSPASPVTTTHGVGPTVWQAIEFSALKLYASYPGEEYVNYTVEWYMSETGGSPEHTQPMSYPTTQISYTPTLTGAKTYWVGVYDYDADCRTPRSPITVAPIPTITVAEGVTYVSRGNTLHLSVPADYQVIQWRKNGTDIAGADSETLTITEPGTYYARVKASAGTPEMMASIEIHGNIVGQQDLNYISTTTPLTETKSIYAVNLLDPKTYTQSTTYYDGLGRPMQSVITQGSPSGLDVVQPIVYDAFGRDARKYLPFTSQNNGWYKPNTDIIDSESGDYKGIALNFYNDPTGKVPTDNRPFSETVFEQSPLSRPLEQAAPGEPWAPDETDTYESTDRTVKNSYETNTTGEVLRWTYAYPTTANPFGLVSAGTASTPVYYDPDELYKTKTKDEQHHEVIEYTDKEGRTVLKRVQAVDGTPSVNDTNYASTYYIYDDFGNLVCVIQPEGVKNITQYMNASEAQKENFLQKWAFRYAYDGRKRMIKKRVPGAKPVYMIYDNRDRLVMTQDGNHRQSGKWTFTKYDALDRPVLTGIYSSTDSADVVQSNVNVFYTALATGTAWYETYTPSGPVFGFDNKSYPQVSGTSNYLTVTYYDNYDGTIVPSGYGPVNQQLPGEVTGTQNPIPGQVTATLVKNLVSGVFMRTVNYYDKKYRVLQTVSDHHKGKVRISNVYDFPGRLLSTKRSYEVNTGSATETTTIVEKFMYDHGGRLLAATHSLNGQPEVVTTASYYNELGQVIAKGLHNTTYTQTDIGQPGVTFGASIERSAYSTSEKKLIATSSIILRPGFHVPPGSTFNAKIGVTQDEAHTNALSGFAQVVDYRYNIRGWLTKINDQAAPGSDMFTMDLRYNDPSANGGGAQFNGNISEAIWKTIGADRQSYGYSYDAMNRLLKGQYFNLSNAAKHGRFNEEIGVPTESRPAYDMNGNIINLRRYGVTTSTTYGLMDNLTYDYANGGNRLLTVTDAIATHAEECGFKEIETPTDYAYDWNGNMTVDYNKGITSIEYNHLNLAARVNKTASDYIIYTYDATGRKLAQQVFGSEAKTTDYIGELVYENNTLQFASHIEGRVVMDGGIDYQYFLKDHLGNVRTTFATRPDSDSDVATNEPEDAPYEITKFLRHDNVKRVTATLFDRTNGASPGTSIRLNGGTNEVYGLARSIAVTPGDVINTEVYAKYVDPNTSNWEQALVSIMSAITNNTGGIVVDGSNFPQSTATFPYAGVLGSSGNNGTAPKVYLNWIVFDNDMVMQPESGFTRITEAAREQGTDIAHERLFNSVPITITKPGYVYIYFSNENETPVEAFFDDFKVEHVKSNVVQVEDNYPFGLTFNSYQRENSVKNQYKFNGKEEQDELGLGWLDYGARMYDASLGRWNKIDRLSEKFVPLSPYTYAACNPIIYIDINGDDIYYFDEKGNYTGYMVKDDGPNRGVYGGEQFIFGDQEHDHLNLVVYKEEDILSYNKDTWFRVETENGLDIDRRIEKAGAYDVNNKWDGLKKILQKKGEGIQDMGIGMEHDDAKFGTHTIISTAKGKVSFSARNYGNFLLAILFAVMTDGMIDGEDTKFFADQYEKWFGEDWADTRDDQKAIELGGEYYKDHYSDNDNTGKDNKRSSDKNYSDDFLKWYYDEKDDDKD